MCSGWHRLPYSAFKASQYNMLLVDDDDSDDKPRKPRRKRNNQHKKRACPRQPRLSLQGVCF